MKPTSILLPLIIFSQFALADSSAKTCEIKIDRSTNLKNSFLVRKYFSTLQKECGVDLVQYVQKNADEKSTVFESCFKKVVDSVTAEINSIKSQKDLSRTLKGRLASRSAGYSNYLKNLLKARPAKVSPKQTEEIVKTYFLMGSDLEKSNQITSSLLQSQNTLTFVDPQVFFGIQSYNPRKRINQGLSFFYEKDLLYNGQIKSIQKNDYDAEALNVITSQKKVDLNDHEILGGSQLLADFKSIGYPAESIYTTDFYILKNKQTGVLKFFEVAAPTEGNSRKVRQEKDLIAGQNLNFAFNRKYKKGRFITTYKIQILCK